MPRCAGAHVERSVAREFCAHCLQPHGVSRGTAFGTGPMPREYLLRADLSGDPRPRLGHGGAQPLQAASSSLLTNLCCHQAASSGPPCGQTQSHFGLRCVAGRYFSGAGRGLRSTRATPAPTLPIFATKGGPRTATAATAAQQDTAAIKSRNRIGVLPSGIVLSSSCCQGCVLQTLSITKLLTLR